MIQEEKEDKEEEDKEEEITISKKVYDDLYNDALLLQCLEGGGVDNWCWYEEAYKEYLELLGEEE